MVNWPEVLPLLRSQGLGCVADEIEKMRTLLDQGAMTISDLKQLIAVESCEGELAFRAGYGHGMNDAKHNYPPRPKGAYNEWRKAPVSEELAPDTCPECHGTRKTVINKHVGVEDCPVCGRDDGEGQAAALSEIDR